MAADFLVYQYWYSSRDFGSEFLERPGLFEAVYFLLNDSFAASGIPFRGFVFNSSADRLFQWI